jgi:hypothetical protein
MKPRLLPEWLAGLTTLAVFVFVAVRAIAQPAPPQIVQQPLSCTKRAHAPAAFSVGVTGSPPLVCQWFKDGIASRWRMMTISWGRIPLRW